MKREKRLNKIKQSPKDVTFHELTAVLKDYGFEMRRSKGSHVAFSHNLIDEIFVVPSNNNPLLRIYVKNAIKYIHQVIELEKNINE